MPRDANRGRIITDSGRNKGEWSPPGERKMKLATGHIHTLTPNSLAVELLSVETVNRVVLVVNEKGKDEKSVAIL
jgi:hypothetical protein